MELDDVEGLLAAGLREWELRLSKDQLAGIIAALEADLADSHDRLRTMEANAKAAGRDVEMFQAEHPDYRQVMGYYAGLCRALEVLRKKKNQDLGDLLYVVRDRKERENS